MQKYLQAGVAVVSSLLIACGGEVAAPESRNLVTVLNHATEDELVDPTQAGLTPEEASALVTLRQTTRIENLEQLRALERSDAIERKVTEWARGKGYLEPGGVLEVQEQPMFVNCAAMSGEMLARAVERGDCHGNSKMVPYGTKTSNCGTSTLWIFRKSDFTKGNAWFEIKLTSTAGPMGRVTYSVDWRNESTGRAGAISDSAWPFRSHWQTKREVQTGNGRVCGTFKGSVLTPKKGICDIAHPTDCEQIY